MEEEERMKRRLGSREEVEKWEMTQQQALPGAKESHVFFSLLCDHSQILRAG